MLSDRRQSTVRKARAILPTPEQRSAVFTYCRALDRLDHDLLRSCYADDARIEMGSIYAGGPDGFAETAMAFMGSMRATRHVIGQMLDLGGVIESYVDAWHLLEDEDGRSNELLVRARYFHRFTDNIGEPKILFQSEVVDYGETRPADTSWFAGDIGMDRGTRGRDDASYAFARR
jgi:hypothetical protein